MVFVGPAQSLPCLAPENRQSPTFRDNSQANFSLQAAPTFQIAYIRGKKLSGKTILTNKDRSKKARRGVGLMASGLRQWCLYISLVALASVSLQLQALAQVDRQSSASVANQHFDYVYRWSDPTVKPRAVAVIVHGLTLHGLTYDAFARHLAERGVIVYAPDLRGYGRDRKTEIDYDKSRADLLELVKASKNEHPDLPLYCIGESMGAGFAMYVAGQEPECVDGLIMSSPAVKRRLHIFPRLALDVGKVFASPKKEVDLSPYFRYFDPKDNRIAKEKLNDPLVRKRLTLMDLYKTLQAIRPTIKYAEKVAAKTPVLIIQGAEDRILRADGIVELMSHLNSKDDTVMYFKGKGHLMLETAYVQTDTLSTIDVWIDRVTQSTPKTLPLSVSYEIHDQLPGNNVLAISSN
jgi:alpha-beta hydrolase superfamily lysophospholipase